MLTDSDPDVLHLRRLLRDLVALSGVPEVWVGKEPSAIVADFADLLVASLDVDSAFVCLCGPKGRAAVEIARGKPWPALLEWLQPYLARGGSLMGAECVPGISDGARTGRGIVVPLGIHSELGLVAAASVRPDFPGENDRLLLSVAANHAATAFRIALRAADDDHSDEASASHQVDDARMRRVLDYISTNIEKEITIAELARVAALSTFHFARMFTRTIGISPHRYVNRLRLENAMAEIAAGRLPLAQVAFNARFSSQASFTRAFHRATGMTPAEYRRGRR